MIQTHLLASSIRSEPVDAAQDLKNRLNTFLMSYDEQDVRRVEVHPHLLNNLTQYIAFVWINEEEELPLNYHAEEE